MFSKNFVSKYISYSRGVKILKEKLSSAKCCQTLENLIGKDVSDKIIKYSYISSTKLSDLKEKKAAVSKNLFVLTEQLKNKYRIESTSKLYPTGSYNKIRYCGAVGLTTATINSETSIGSEKAFSSNEFLTASNETTSNVLQSVPIIEPIPEPPLIPDPSTYVDVINSVNALGEPSLASLGLGGWTPVGLIQNSLEYLHVLGIPWWEAIAIGTVVVRFLMFPLVVMAQRNAAKMNNLLPQLQVLQLKMTEARQTGNQLDAARYSQEMVQFMKEKNLNPLKNMMVPFAQMPLFVSFFMGLRKMSNAPVESLKEGGLFWFTDLTVPDQFFILPVITSITLWITIEVGTDAGKLTSQNMALMKYFLRAMPVIILPFTVNFPGAILCYWVSSNFISLAQVGFLKIPKVRNYFNIEPLIKHDPKNLPIASKGFVGGVKDSWTNMKLTRELEERKRFDEMQFQRAGRGPVVKTYKYDPTKEIRNSVNAKAR